MNLESLGGYFILLVAFCLVGSWLLTLRRPAAPRRATAVLASLAEALLITAAAGYLTPFTTTPRWLWWILAALVMTGAVATAQQWKLLVVEHHPAPVRAAVMAGSTQGSHVPPDSPAAPPLAKAPRKLVSLAGCVVMLLILLYARFS